MTEKQPKTEAAWTTIFYRNPRLLILAVGLILVAGSTSFALLPRLEDPQMLPRAANVNTRFPGADAQRVETLVTEKIEDSLREIDDIKRLRTNSRTGISTISIELRDEVMEPDTIWSRIRDKIDDATTELPSGAMEPEFDQLDIKAYAILVSVTWEAEMSPSFAVLRREAMELEDRIKALSGTEKIDLFGDPGEQIYVNVDPARTAALGLTPADLARQVSASDSKDSAGQVRNSRTSLTLDVDEQLDTLSRLGATPIRYGADDGSFVLLSDIARLEKGTRDPAPALSLIDGKPGIVLGVMARPDSRIDYWSAEVLEAVNTFRDELGSGLAVDVLFNQDEYVSDRLESLFFNLVLGAIAVSFVVFVLMGWRSAVVVASALPLSALMVLTGLRWLDIPIHQMSVTGLIIALGLLIDNAIVMVDAVGQRIRRGLPSRQAIADSVQHLAVPLLGSTLTTAFAFAPIALMPGPAGEFVGSIAISVILAIFSSLLIALTIVPTLATMGIRVSPRSDTVDNEAASTEGRVEKPHWYKTGINAPRLARVYHRLLQWILERPLRGIGIGVVLPVLGFIGATQLQEQFFPPADRDQLYLELELPMGSSIEQTELLAKEIRQELLADDQVERVHWFLGESGPAFYYNVIPRRKGTPRYAQAMVELVNGEDSREVIHRLQDQLNLQFPQARVLVRQLEQGPPFEAPVELRLYGPDVERLQDLGDELRILLADIPEVIHMTTELSEPQPKLALKVDEEKARLLGLDHTQIAEQLRGGVDGIPGGSILEGTEEIPVSVRMHDKGRRDLDEVRSLEFVSLTRSEASSDADRFDGIPMSSIADVALEPEVATLPRYNGQRMNEVKAYVRAGVLPSKVVSKLDLQRRIDAGEFEMPAGYRWEYGGEQAERNQAVGNLMANVGLLAIMMVATLVLSFRSFRLASIILFVGALSMGLGMGALWLFQFPFGFMAIVGTMGLIGVAINDSIVVLASIREDERAAAGDIHAMSEVVMESSRHVISTTLTTMAGFAPLVIAGGGFWPPLAVAVAGGVGGATILALLFVPACYRMFIMLGRSPQAAI